MILLPDTHALAWWLDMDSRLSATAKETLQAAIGELVVPVMVLVELKYMGLKRGLANFLEAELADLRLQRDVRVFDFTEEIASRIDTRLDIHDSMIIATALHYAALRREAVVVVTKDGTIRKSGIVETIW